MKMARKGLQTVKFSFAEFCIFNHAGKTKQLYMVREDSNRSSTCYFFN